MDCKLHWYPILLRIIMRQMNQQLNLDSNLKILADSFSAVNLNKISGLKHTSPIAAGQVIFILCSTKWTFFAGLIPVVP